jgi:hypothetical protein
MNDKDKEAFECWQKEIIQELKFNNAIGDNKHKGSLEFAWQAACEYKHKEIEDLYKHLKHEHDLYRKHLKVYEDEIQEYKEAARSEANIVDELQAQNKKLREALEFYADRNNWKFQSYSSDCEEVIDFNDLGCRSYTDKADFACSSGGRRAREALKEIKE